jgi:glucose/arabinose dehydrogenase
VRFALALLATFAVMVPPAHAAHLERLGRFAQPVYVTGFPGRPDRLVVVERYGRIRTLQRGRKRTLADLRGQVLVADPRETVDQRGLFSVSFLTRRRWFVQYVDLTGRERVDEIRNGRRRLLLDLGPAKTQHHGGQLQIGPDRMLYVSTGMGDDPSTSQDPGSTGGKILRVDPDTGAWSVYALGLRNPWRFSFSGRWLLIGDVGDSHTEEIDVAGRAGANFGWPGYEGRARTRAADVPGATAPAITFRHRRGRCAVTGGYVVRGRYWYGDLCTGAVWSARFRAVRLGTPRRAGVTVPYLVSFGRDAASRLYAVSFSGAVYRLPAPHGRAGVARSVEPRPVRDA